MKKVSKLILICLVFIAALIFPSIEVHAASSFSVSSNATSVSAGGTATITIRATECVGQFTISASNGAKVSSSSIWIDSGYGSSASSTVTVTAPSSGSFTVSVTASSVSTDMATALTGTKSVTISVASSSSGSSSSGSTSSGSSSSTTTTDTRDTDSSLKSLSINNGTLTPAFSKSEKSYKVSVLDIGTIKISAEANSSEATVSGTGTKDLVLGDNEFSVKVTAENNTTTTYTILVTLDKTPDVFTSYDDLNLGVVQNQNDVVIPEHFEETSVDINGQEVIAYYNPVLNLTIVYMVDDSGDKDFYIYNEGITSKYIQLAFLGRTFVFIDIPEDKQTLDGFIYEEIEIGEAVVNGWSFEEDSLASYKIFKAYDEQGDYMTYMYDVVSQTIIIKPEVNFVPYDAVISPYSEEFTTGLFYTVIATSTATLISAVYITKNILFSKLAQKR